MKHAALWILFVASTGGAYAQEVPKTPPSSTAESQPSSPREPEVAFIFALTDKKGNPVSDTTITRENLQITDGGKPVTEIVEVRKADDLPVRYALVLDLSGSQRQYRREYITLARETVEFLRSEERPGIDHAIVVVFRAKVSAAMPLDADLVSQWLENADLVGGSALYDAIFATCQALAAANNRPERRVLLLLSDGEDNQSQHTLEQAEEAARRGGVAIYSIRTGERDPSAPSRAGRALRELSDATAGVAVEPFNSEELRAVLRELAAVLHNQYLVVYRPAEFRADGKLRKVKISVGNSNLRIRAQQGYWAPKVSGK